MRERVLFVAAPAELFPGAGFGLDFHFSENKIKNPSGIRFGGVFTDETAHHILFQIHE